MWLSDSILVSVSSDKRLIVWSFEGENPKIAELWNQRKEFKEAH